MGLSQDKKIVFWGTGKIANMCLKHFPDIVPQFFIDSNWNTTEKFQGFPVYRPDEVKDWDELFVIVATGVVAYEEIENLLKKKGLIKEKDYVYIRQFLGHHKKTVAESLAFIKDSIYKNECYKNSTLIYAAVFVNRISDILTNFFRAYGQSKQNCVFITLLNYFNEEYAEKQIGMPVFDVPSICMWPGKKRGNVLGLEDELEHIDEFGHESELSADEKKWLRNMEQRKSCLDQELSYKITAEIYWYFKKVFAMIQPKEVIIWGGWQRVQYILADISKRNNIPFGFMEFGWIPGTIQFDRRGIAGQSEYAVHPEKILNLPIMNKDMDMKAIREYIKKTQLDNGMFRLNDLDEESYSRIDKTRKTIFFVGMDDFGMKMNPQSEYWSEYVSSYFRSTLDAVLYVAKICERNDWNLVFKPHPSSVNDAGNGPAKLPQSLIFIRNMQIDRLIESADAVVSIASSVDYKALIYGKPLVSLGHTTLHEKGCCYEPKDMDDIERQLKLAVDNGMTEQQNANFERHMAQLLENYLWDDLSERDLRYGLSLDTDFFGRLQHRVKS